MSLSNIINQIQSFHSVPRIIPGLPLRLPLNQTMPGQPSPCLSHTSLPIPIYRTIRSPPCNHPVPHLTIRGPFPIRCCEIRCLPKGCRVTSSVIGCKLSWRMRTDSEQRSTFAQLTPHKSQNPDRWSTQTSKDTHAAQLQGRKSQPELLGLQSGERARTTTTTQNTCSSPGYPVTTDLSHFPEL